MSGDMLAVRVDEGLREAVARALGDREHCEHERQAQRNGLGLDDWCNSCRADAVLAVIRERTR